VEGEQQHNHGDGQERGTEGIGFSVRVSQQAEEANMSLRQRHNRMNSLSLVVQAPSSDWIRESVGVLVQSRSHSFSTPRIGTFCSDAPHNSVIIFSLLKQYTDSVSGGFKTRQGH
jgi:hypothetical protein